MNNSNNGAFLGIFAIGVYIAAWVGTGTMAWNWIEPTSFWGAIKFMLAWGLLGYIAQIIGLAIIAGIASITE